MVNRIQKLRKTADLKLSDRIVVQYNAGAGLKAAIQNNQVYVCEQTLALELKFIDKPKGETVEKFDVEGEMFVVAITRKCL